VGIKETGLNFQTFGEKIFKNQSPEIIEIKQKDKIKPESKQNFVSKLFNKTVKAIDSIGEKTENAFNRIGDVTTNAIIKIDKLIERKSKPEDLKLLTYFDNVANNIISAIDNIPGIDTKIGKTTVRNNAENIFAKDPNNCFGVEDLRPQERKEFEKPGVYTKNVEWIRKTINKDVKESHLHNIYYQSQAEISGGKMVVEKDQLTGKDQVILETTAHSNKTDIKRDKMVRAFDDNVVREPLKMLIKHPRELLKRLPGKVEAKRYRAQTPAETYKIVEKLGLTNYFGPHEKGLIFKHPEILSEGTSLLDIFRQDVIGNTELRKIYRSQAIQSATEYIKQIHNERKSGFGDLRILNIIFQKREGERVSNPTLLLPNVQYNPNLNIPLKEQKATDLIDFIFSIGAEEDRWTQGNSINITNAIDMVLNTYNEPDIIHLIKSYMKRGRLTMQAEGNLVQRPDSLILDLLRPILSMNNKQRMKAGAATSAGLRRLIIERCEEYEKNMFPLQ